jgi:hypothetical protein
MRSTSPSPRRWDWTAGIVVLALLLALAGGLYVLRRGGWTPNPRPVSEIARDVGRDIVQRSLPERPYPDPLLRGDQAKAGQARGTSP